MGDAAILRRDVLFLGLGAAAGLAGFGLRARPWRDRAPGRIALWVADRAGHAVYGLDADALPVSRTRVVAPTAIVARRGGRALVRSAIEGRSDGGARWVEVGPRGSVVPAADHPRLDAPHPFGVTDPELRRVVRVRRSRGGAAAWVLRSAPADVAALERWVRPAGSPSSDVTWRRAFRFALPWSARALAATSHGAWVVGDRVPEVRFFTSTGRLVVRRVLDDVDGADAAVTASRASGGGVWIACCGALARLDRIGRRMPGQGGFAHLVALARATV